MWNRKITGLIACDPTGIIGEKRRLPWTFPEEVAFFRQTTAQQIMITGATTYEEMPRSFFHERYCVVFSKSLYKSSQDHPPTVIFVSSLNEFLNLKNLPENKSCYMIGGAEIAKLFLVYHLIDDFLLSIMTKSYSGDTVFPLDLIEHWPRTQLKKTADFSTYHYKNPLSQYV